MSIQDQFVALVEPGSKASFADLEVLFNAAQSVEAEFMFGEWTGGHFALGHPIEAQLDAMKWAGKSFISPDDVAPIVCYDDSGTRFANSVFGGARLREVRYRGSVTATMIYDNLPMFDHFRRIDDDTVIGAMDRKGSKRAGYFYLTRIAADSASVVEPNSEASEQKSQLPSAPITYSFTAHTPPLLATAAVLRVPGGPFALEQVELEAPRSNEVLVRLVTSGLCHTDVVVARGAPAHQLPMVLGHEGAGIVEQVGADVTDIRVGDRVVLSYAWCGTCRNCRRDRMAYCTSSATLNLLGVRTDGSTGMRTATETVRGRFCGQSSFATHALAAAHTVVAIHDEIPFEVLAPLGCGVLTGAGAVLNSLQPEAGSSIAVFAAGSVGLSAIMAAKAAGCERIIAVDPKPERRALALDVGATDVLEPDDAKDAIIEITGGGVDYALDCIGHADVIRAAVRSMTAPGVCVTVGIQGRGMPIELDQSKLIGKGQTLRGVIEGDAVPRTFIPRLVDLHREGKLPVERLITTFAFDQINDAVRASLEGKAAKAVLVMPG